MFFVIVDCVCLTGYARVVLALASFYYMPTSYGLAVFCYLTSGLLDAFDGHAARMLNQCKYSCSVVSIFLLWYQLAHNVNNEINKRRQASSWWVRMWGVCDCVCDVCVCACAVSKMMCEVVG